MDDLTIPELLARARRNVESRTLNPAMTTAMLCLIAVVERVAGFESPPDEGEDDEGGFDLSASNIEGVEKLVAEISDVAVLDELLVEEAAGKNRKGALEVIEARIHALEEEEE